MLLRMRCGVVIGLGLVLTIAGCGGGDSGPTELAADLAPSYSVMEPDVTQEEWDQAKPGFAVTEKGLTVMAHGPGHVVNHAEINVWTQGRVILPFIPSVRADVLYTYRINGVATSGMFSGDYDWSPDGFGFWPYTVGAFNCASVENQSISASSNHFAQYNAVLKGLRLNTKVGPIPHPTVQDPCPPWPEPPTCPEDWTPEGDGCLGISGSAGPPTGGDPEGGDDATPPGDEGCMWYLYTHWNWYYGEWRIGWQAVTCE